MEKKFYVEYFTDPLCCWSWGMEPQWRKLRYLMKDRMSYRYVMGGLLRDWEHFQDQLNSIGRPSQMGPLWMEAKQMTGQPIEEFMWIKNPVDSSYPACMAVKAAEDQSAIAAEAILRKLREAVMMQRKDIGDKNVILEIAAELQKEQVLNLSAFEAAFFSSHSADLFRKDLDLIKLKNITRFPTLLISYGDKTIQITGYRPFSVLVDAFKALEPDFELEDNVVAKEYNMAWAHLTEREKEEIEASL